jgi:hypothetical protein
MDHAHLHRPFRVLAALTVAVGLLPIAFGASLADPLQLAGAYFGWTVAVYLWAAGGTVLAATTFAPGEPMRPGWLLVSASYAVLLPARLLAGPTYGGLVEGAVRLPSAVSLLSVGSASLGLAGFLLLARAWHAAELDVTSRASRLAMRLAALAVAVALAGPDLVERLPSALAGDPMAVTDVVTDFLDGALFVVAVPVLRATLALGGGLMAWPWGLLTLSLFAWLGYDAAVIWGETLGLAPRTGRVLEEVMRTLGASAAFSAGVAQRWLMGSPPGAGEAPPAA